MEILELFKRQLASTSGSSSKNTIKNYVSDIRHFMAWFEATTGSEFDAASVTADVILLYKNSMGGLLLDGQLHNNSQLSASSMKRHLSSIRKFFTVLEGENLVRENPFERIVTEETVEPTDYWHLKSFKDYLMLANASKITVKNYLSDISGFARWYEEAVLPTIDNPLSSNQGFYLITQSVIEDYRKRLVEIQNAAPRTINRKLSALRRYLEFAARKGFISNQEISISSVEAEITKEVTELPKLPLSEITTQGATQQKSYSKIPPVRLIQKLLINPYLLLEEGAANAITGFLIGKKVTGIAKLPQKLSAQIASKNALRIQNQGISTLLGVRNIEKEFYAPEKVSLLGLPIHQKLFHHVRFTRPNWYKRYHNYAFVHYVHFALLVIFASGVGVALYQNLVVQKQTPTFAAATAPPRILSFQGRLTDALDNPITSPQPVRFMIYNSLAATGAAELWEETRTISPDQDGIFSVLLGSDSTGANASSCGSFPPGSPYNTSCLIPSTVFSDNSQIWLGVTIANSTELAPRQKIATVGYATNSEFLQGLPPTSAVSSFINAVLALDSTGSFNLNDGIEHTFQVSNGTFTLKAQTLNLTTSLGTNGNIILNPEGLGKVDVQKPIINNSNTGNLVTGGVEINDRFGVLATESAVAAFIVNNNTTGGDIFAASSSGTTKFAIANDGSITSGFYTGQNAVLYGTQTTGLIAQATTASTGLCLQSGASTPTWGTCGSSYWNLTTDNGALTPFSSTLDLLIGGQTTASAKFAFINNASGAPTASISGNLSIAVPTGVNGANSFNMFNGSTLNFQTSAGGNSGLTSRLFIANDGRIGIGTTSPFVRNALDIRGLSGTSSTATISANSSYATLVVDNAGSGDLFAASASGVQNFVIKNNGDIMVGPGGAGKITAAIIDPYLVQNQKTTGIQSLTFQTLGASNADFIFQNVSTELSRLTMAGQLQLPITGSTGGIVLGGDTQLFRGDVNRIDVASGDSFNLVSGSLLTGGTTRIDSSGNGTFNTINVTSCTGCGATGANSPFYQLAGAIVPINSTNDFLLGATSTASAKFAVLNINSGTPTASVSANSGNNALYVTGDGTLATTNRGNLTIGNSSTYNTTGNVLINPNGTGNVGIGTTSPSELLTLASIGSANIKINADTDNATETDIAQLLLTQDGGVSTANLGMDSGNNLVIGVNSSTSPNIYFGTNTTGTTFADSSTAKMTILSGGNVGIGDTSPDAKLEVLGTTEQLRLTYTDGTVDSRMTVNSSGNLTIDNTGTKTTITDNLEVSGRTTQFSNQYPIYRWYWGGSNGDNDWKNIANITNTGVTIYDGYSFSVKITNMDTNAGSSDTPISLQYYASIRGSLAGDNAVVSGPIADYVRVIKTATDVYELQVRQIADWKHMQVEVQALSTCCGSPVLAYVDSPVDGSTSGTVYSAAIDHTDYATNFYIGGSALTFAQATAVNIANSSTTALNFESGLLNLDSQNSRVGIGTTTPTAKLDIAGDASTSGSLVFNGSNKSIDILNGSRLDFQTSPGGDSGLTNRMTLANNGNFNIGGDTTPDSLLSVGSTSQFQVNSSGTIAAATGITSSGTITFSGFSTNGGLLYTNGSGVLAQTGTGGATQCLLGGAGTPTFGSCLSGTNTSPFYEFQGAIVPGNTTEDFILGGTASSSARFIVNGLATGISPTASISATNGNGIYLSAVDGTIQSLRNNTLSIGGNTTGVVAINPLASNFTGIGTVSPIASLDVRGSLGIIGGGTLAVASISGRTSYAALAIDNLSPVGDLFTASSSSNMQFVIKNNGFVGLATAAPTARLDVNGSASVSSALTFRTGAGSIQTTALNTLSIGGNTTGVLSLSPTGSNFVGIGTQSPLASLDVRNALGFPGGGTLPIASISGRTSFAALQVDNTLGDLFSASSSGLNRFVIKQNGNVGIGTATPGARLALAVSNNVEGGIKFGDDANLFRSGTSTLASLNNFFVGSAGTDIGTTGYIASNSAVDSTNTLHNEDVFESSNVRIGSDGFFKAAYVDENNAYLQYAQCTNIDCSTSNLTTADNVAHTHGSWLTMGNDGFGRIVYTDTNLSVLNFLRCTNASCSTNNKTSINFSGEQLDVPFLIASDGFARIVFTDQITNNLTFTQCTNADCTATASAVLDASDGSSLNAPFALGSDNFARIIYTDQGSGDLNFVQCTNASCSTRNTTTIASSDYSSPDYLAIAGDGFARFVYANATSGDLNFVQCTNASCSTRNTTAIDAGDFSDHNATSLGSDGFARIVFRDNGNNDLVYVQCTNADCSTSNTSVLDVGDFSGAYTLALDGSNNAQIVFQDGTNNKFYAVLCTNASCSTNTGQIIIGTGSGMNSWSASYVGGDGAFRFSFMDTTMYLQVGVLSRHSYNPNGNELYLAGDLGVNNNIFADGSIFVGGSTNIAGDLNLEGTLNANGGLNLTDNLSIGGTLTVTGVSTFNNSVTVNSSLQSNAMYSYGYTNYNFSNNGGVVYTNGSGTFAQTSVGSAGQCLQSIGGGAPTWGTCGGGSTTFTANAGAIVQSNTTMDVLFGGTSTSSAKVSFTNFNGAAGTINNWANTTDTGLSGQLEQFGLVFLNGYVYHVGGYDGPTVLDTVRYARVKNDGTLDNWVTSPNTLPEARLWHGTVTVNGYIYVIGGHSSVATPTNPAVYFAKVNADGTVGAWSSTTSIPSPRIRITHSVAAANGYIYVVGGENSSAQTTVWYAKVNADGTVGAWTSGSSLPVATSDQAVVVDNGHIYSMGGLAPSATNAIYYAKLNYDGSIGPWIGNPNNLASADTMHSGIAVNGFVYILGGINNSTTVYFAKFNSDGTIPAFSTNPASLPESHQGSGITYGNGYIYISGGFGTDNVAYGSIARVSLAANLDLLGLTSTSLASSSGIAGGGSIFAGNIFSKNLEVAGSGTIWGNLAVSNTLSSSSLSVSGRTSGKALAIFNETGNQDIFTASASGLTKFIIANSGNVGIGTALSPTGANPTSPLQVYGLSTQPIASISGKTSGPTLLLTNDGSGDILAASVSGVQKFRINAAGDLIIGDGSGKIYGGGFDPLYTIDGQKFSTYASSINGMKEEYIGTANLAYDAAAGGYAYTLDFNNFEYGTELWTFSRVIDPDLTKVNVLLTPTSQARTWFRRDPVNRKLILYSDRPTSVTYRFTAPRFDYALYPSSNHSHDITGLQAPSAPGTTGSGEADPMDSFFASLSIQFNNGVFTILDGFGNIVHRVDGFSNLMAANLEAGFIHARNLAVDTFTAGSASLGNATANTFAVAANTITIGGQDIRQFIIDTVTAAGFGQNSIISPIASVETIKTNTIRPLAEGGDINVKGKLITESDKAATDSASVSLEVIGSASISGSLAVNDIQTNNATLAGSLTTTNASISGTLAAGDINVNQLQIRDNLKVGTVRADFGIFEQGITSMGPVTANILTATDQLAVGSNFTISNNAINTVGTELAIQSLRQGDISFEGGLIRMDTDGNMTVNGNFNLLGEIDAVYGVFSGTLTTPALATDLISPVADSDISLSFKDSKFNIQNSKTATGSSVLSIDNKGNIQSSGSATFAKLNFNLVGKAEATSLTEAVATGSAGFATLRSGQPELTIKNNIITSTSLIYITPFGNTDNKVLYLLRQIPESETEDGSFTIGISGQLPTHDIQFNWLIVN